MATRGQSIQLKPTMPGNTEQIAAILEIRLLPPIQGSGKDSVPPVVSDMQPATRPMGPPFRMIVA